jgi:pyruvate formate lyase activating enzyme
MKLHGAKTATARFWEAGEEKSVLCGLCPRNCKISPGDSGFCKVRYNDQGSLLSLSHGRPIALQVDPIEKKPLAEFMPGTKTFSIGTYGCNLDCSFCQNHHLSRGFYSTSEIHEYREFSSPKKIVETALESGCASIAFTYNEPIVWIEYMEDIAKLARNANLATVMVSNAYMSKAPAEELLPLIDAANFDMKGFSEKFYKKMTGGMLADVLDTIKLYHSLDGHLELTNLVIPGENDSPKMINAYLKWVAENLGMSIPLHFSAYYPHHKFRSAPPTPHSTLYRIRESAISAGFTSIHLGNI